MSQDNGDDDAGNATFKSLGVDDQLCKACETLKWATPSKIQTRVIPVALEGKDIIALAETGSGKTGAFALPILNDLLERRQKLFALVLTPTRELAVQIADQFKALGSRIGVTCAVIVGGLDLVSQQVELGKKPHIIIATPGRLLQHIKETKGFGLKQLKYLVIDEADRILNEDFKEELSELLAVLPRERHTYLFSATMTNKIEKLKRACLRDPVKIEVSNKYQTVESLISYHLFVPALDKDVYFVWLLNSEELQGKSCIVFCDTCANTQRVALMIRSLGFNAIPLHGQMAQNKRLGSLNKFKSKDKAILVSTDVASRGLDIPHVDVVINLYIPTHSKDYIHRVGRTARANRSGKAFTFVTQYDVELFLKIEQLLGKKIDKFMPARDEVMVLKERVGEAQIRAKLDMAEASKEKGRKRKRGHDADDDTEESSGIIKKRLKNKNTRR